MTVFLVYLVWEQTLDYWWQFVYRWMSRRDENDADRFAVRLGYGKHLKQALTRNFGLNLDNIFISWIDTALTASHPPLLERLRLIESDVEKILFEEPIELNVAIGDHNESGVYKSAETPHNET